MKLFSRLFARPPRLQNLSLGTAGETWACYLYERRGAEIVARNYAIYGPKKLGEIDIVCRRGKSLIVVEVKTRQDEKFMGLEDTVDWRKQAYLRRMAKLFIQNNPQYDDYEIQIDVVAIVLDPVDNSVRSVKLIENAIEDVQ